jgi:hypothetical protein
MTPLLFQQAAYADYAPNSGDIVGVGSDTLQNMIDFIADGDDYGDSGYNAALNKYKLVNFDATADANVRLSYGVDGGQAAQTVCTPGTGATAGTANQTTTHADAPCVQNPTVELRAGKQPVQRPNGSSAGTAALAQDIIGGNNGGTNEIINYARSSSNKDTTFAGSPATGTTVGSFQGVDRLEIATDTLPMLETTTPVSNAVPLNVTQLALIYAQATCTITWNDPRIGGTSPDVIIPIIPQVGSGTRSYFLGQLSLANAGACAQVGEENDPEALGATSSPQDAIAPVSLGRLDLFNGTSPTAGNVKNANGPGLFLDPSCAYLSGAAACGTGSVSAKTWVPNTVNPTVQPISGTPLGTDGGGTAFNPTRPLYLYFRSEDGCASYTATTGTHCTSWSGGPYTEHPMQPGTLTNWVHTLFWDNGAATPYILTAAGQALLQNAGVTPLTAATQQCVQVFPVATPQPACPF